MHGHRHAEAVPLAGDRLDVHAVLRPIVERLTDLFDTEIDPLIEVDERAFRPEVLTDLVP
jgi:hypothetical protein